MIEVVAPYEIGHYVDIPWSRYYESVFLAGGISNCPDWQADMVNLLSDTDLVLYNPRRPDFPMGNEEEGKKQIKWEFMHLQKAHAVLFWFPKETDCPITLYELGRSAGSVRSIFVGCHPEYSRRLDVIEQLKLARPGVTVVDNLNTLSLQVKNHFDRS